MKLTLLLNGEPMDKSELTKEIFHRIITTQNPDSAGVKDAVNTAGGVGFCDALLAAGDPKDMIEVLVDGEFAGRGRRGNIVKKARIALTRDEWQTEVGRNKGVFEAI